MTNNHCIVELDDLYCATLSNGYFLVPSPTGGGLGWGAMWNRNTPHPNPLPEGEGTVQSASQGEAAKR